MKTLLLKLSGPLQSWGSRSHFETRHTDFYPSKSAVLGMIAAALGLRRSDTASILKLHELGFGVRVDQQGKLLRDYHTARCYKSSGEFKRTYVTNRYYLEDAVFVVGLSHEDDVWIEALEESLRHPYFQPFMGRRSLPLPADFILGSVCSGLQESLSQQAWAAADWYKKQGRLHSLTLYLDSHLAGEGALQMRRDKALSFDQKNRQYAYRYETKIEIPIPESVPVLVSTEHDALAALGDV